MTNYNKILISFVECVSVLHKKQPLKWILFGDLLFQGCFECSAVQATVQVITLLEMARMYLLKTILDEAHSIDNHEVRIQNRQIRGLSLLTRNDDYVNVYRLTKELIDQLELDLLPLIKCTKHRGKGLSTRIKILCTLSFLANGSYQKIIKENVRTYLSQPSASRCINEIVETLNNPEIIKRYIRFPQNIQERQILKERFYEKFRISGVIGCIDGTLVALKRPADNEERFYCRKGYHARNVQLITDANLSYRFRCWTVTSTRPSK